MLAQELLSEFEKGLNPQKPAESKIPARIVGYGEISAIFEIEAEINVCRLIAWSLPGTISKCTWIF